MAATVNKVGRTIELTVIDADWVWSDSVPDKGIGGIPIATISFTPGAANDVMIIKEASATGPSMFEATCLTAEPRVLDYFGVKHKPFLDFSECTLTAGHKVIILLAERA